MFSGGLDSLLAIRVMLDQGIKVIPVNFDHGFFFGAYEDLLPGEAITEFSGLYESGVITKKKYKGLLPPEINPVVVDISADFYDMMRKPKHGFGANMNPCIDCKIMMMKKIKELMPVFDAGFLITGEVIGQRPMTQNPQAMVNIENESGLKGFLLRPLCAKLLEPTEPEKLGWVDREKLLDINGRSRKVQLAMADDAGWGDFVKAPAGGCILTDESYSKRLRDFLMGNPKLKFTRGDMKLLTVGRHFRRIRNTFIIGRKHNENIEIIKHKDKGYIFECKGFPGPAALATGELDDDMKRFIASAVAGYSHAKLDPGKEVEIEINKGMTKETVMVRPMDINMLAGYRIDS
jgi:tRNA U34 2-thiouridine synthase MnmA/TrmU